MPSFIAISPNIQSCQPVLTHTRVPVKNLFDYLKTVPSLNEFLEDFPSVTRQQAVDLLEEANRILTSTNLEQLYAAIA